MPKWRILGWDILLPFIINSKIQFWCHCRKTPLLYLHPTLTPILLLYCIMMWPPFCPPSLQVSWFLQWPRALSMWHHMLSFPQKGSYYYPHFPDGEMRVQNVRLAQEPTAPSKYQTQYWNPESLQALLLCMLAHHQLSSLPSIKHPWEGRNKLGDTRGSNLTNLECGSFCKTTNLQ